MILNIHINTKTIYKFWFTKWRRKYCWWRKETIKVKNSHDFNLCYYNYQKRKYNLYDDILKENIINSIKIKNNNKIVYLIIKIKIMKNNSYIELMKLQ